MRREFKSLVLFLLQLWSSSFSESCREQPALLGSNLYLLGCRRSGPPGYVDHIQAPPQLRRLPQAKPGSVEPARARARFLSVSCVGARNKLLRSQSEIIVKGEVSDGVVCVCVAKTEAIQLTNNSVLYSSLEHKKIQSMTQLKIQEIWMPLRLQSQGKHRIL